LALREREREAITTKYRHKTQRLKQNRTNQPEKKKNRKIIAVRNDEVLPLLRQQTNKQTRSIITPPQNLSLLLLGLVQSVPTKHSFFSTCAPHTHPTLSEGRERERERKQKKKHFNVVYNTTINCQKQTNKLAGRDSA
jgi:hypothetical protein